MVFPTNAAHPAVPDTQAQFVQLFRHPGPAVAAQTGAMLVADMRQQHHVPPLPMRWWSVFPGAKASISNAHQATGPLFGKQAAIVVQERELHGFWAAKN